MTESVTIANMSIGLWGVWSSQTHDLIGAIRRYQEHGGTYWNVERSSGDCIQWFDTFRAARNFAQHYDAW